MASVVLLVLNAFKTSGDYSTNGPLALPTAFSLDAFTQYLQLVDYPRALTNSIIISTLVALLGAALSLITAYGIGMGRVRGSGVLLALFLLATMLPQESLIYPLFYGAQATNSMPILAQPTISE